MNENFAMMRSAGAMTSVEFDGRTFLFDTYEAAKAAMFAMTNHLFEAAKARAAERDAEFAAAA